MAWAMPSTLWAARLTMMTISPGRSAGDSICSTRARKTALFMVPSRTQGGDEAARGETADEGGALPVAVWHRPVDPLAARAAVVAPRHVGRRPGLVDEHQPLWVPAGLSRSPCGALVGKLGPVLLFGPERLYFQRQPEPGQGPVHQAQARGHAVGGEQPDAQLVQDGVRPLGHLGPDRVVMRRELELLMVALRPRLGFTGRRASAQRLVDVGNA